MINFEDYIQIGLSDEMFKYAEMLAKKRRQSTFGSFTHLNIGCHERDEVIGVVGEIAMRSLLITQYRAFKCTMTSDKSDDGVDFLINAGGVNVKCSEYYPDPRLRLMTRRDINHSADYFAQCFIDGDVCYFVGMETNTNLIDEANLTTIKSAKYNGDFKAYALQVGKLSIKPASILHEPFTICDGRVLAYSFVSCLNWGLDKM